MEEGDVEVGGEGPPMQKPKGTTAGNKLGSGWLQRLTRGPRGWRGRGGTGLGSGSGKVNGRSHTGDGRGGV